MGRLFLLAIPQEKKMKRIYFPSSFSSSFFFNSGQENSFYSSGLKIKIVHTGVKNSFSSFSLFL